jgi:hypothetical protein
MASTQNGQTDPVRSMLIPPICNIRFCFHIFLLLSYARKCAVAGNVHINKTQYFLALAQFEKALEASPNIPEILLGYCQAIFCRSASGLSTVTRLTLTHCCRFCSSSIVTRMQFVNPNFSCHLRHLRRSRISSEDARCIFSSGILKQ